MVRIGVVGCGGRMGQALVREIAQTAGAALAGGTERAGSPVLGADIGSVAGLKPLGLQIGADAAALFDASDVVIDFTAPAASLHHAQLAAEHGCALVVGTTGLSAEETAQLREAAGRAALVHAPNMSLGVNLLLALVERVAGILGDDYDIEIVEMHHRHKVDAPSGTALGLGRAAAAGRQVALDAVKETVRDGHPGPRVPGRIGFATLRGGDVVGDHTVIFAGDGERLELGHKASSRTVFAKGAVRAALWAAGKRPGFYGMADVLGL
jgi:4-hydroxy-tetrahydrodipicolinate reductase